MEKDLNKMLYKGPYNHGLNDAVSEETSSFKEIQDILSHKLFKAIYNYLSAITSLCRWLMASFL